MADLFWLTEKQIGPCRRISRSLVALRASMTSGSLAASCMSSYPPGEGRLSSVIPVADLRG